jgi:hypothetical protein
VVWANHRVTGRFRTYHIARRGKIRHDCTCSMRRADDLEAEARALLARVPSELAHPLALGAPTVPPGPATDLKAQKRQEIADALTNLARLRVLHQPEKHDCLDLREELKGRERTLTPRRRS